MTDKKIKTIQVREAATGYWFRLNDREKYTNTDFLNFGKSPVCSLKNKRLYLFLVFLLIEKKNTTSRVFANN